MTRGGAILGKQISSARVERNLTREDLGTLLGISPEQVAKYESGEESMPAGLLYRLSEAFGLPVTAFFRQSEDGQSKDGQSKDGQSADTGYRP